MNDLFGHALAHYINYGSNPYEIVECLDGHIHVNEYATYVNGVLPELVGSFAPCSVVDYGCGVGRHIPLLKYIGHKVVGIEQSSTLVDLAHTLGRPEVIQGDLFTHGIPYDLGLLLCNGVALLGTRKQAVGFLECCPCTHLIVEGRGLPTYTEYAVDNMNEGKLPGEMKFRHRWGSYASPWYDRLIASRNEFTELASEGGYHTVTSTRGPNGTYVTHLIRP